MAEPLSLEMIQDIAQYVENGNYLEVAAAAVGISRSTYRKWLVAGQQLNEVWPDLDLDEIIHGVAEIPQGLVYNDILRMMLARRMNQADAKAEAYAVLIVRKHMPDQWTAAMTFLERRFPDRWRKRQTVESVDGGQSSMDEQALIEDPEAVRLLHEALEQVAIEGQARPALAEGTKEEPPAEAEGSGT